jgi:hypothetical protein
MNHEAFNNDPANTVGVIEDEIARVAVTRYMDPEDGTIRLIVDVDSESDDAPIRVYVNDNPILTELA